MVKERESTSANKKAFIKEYLKHGNVGDTLDAIGVKSRKTFYNWLENDEAFKNHYYDELVPTSRDRVKGRVYKTATGESTAVICPVCDGEGKYANRNCHGCRGRGWVEVHADGVQLTAAFAFLRATNHIENRESPDRQIYQDKSQVELSGANGGPVLLKWVEDGTLNP